MKLNSIDPNPKTYNTNWLLFDDTVYSSIRGPACFNTIEGVCYTTESLEECVNKCDEHEKCSYGYYLSSKDNNICVPMYNSFLEDNYAYELISTKNFENLNYKGTAFLDTRSNNYPPKKTSTVFYDDIVRIELGENTLSLQADTKDVSISNFKEDFIEFRIYQLLFNTEFTRISLNYNSKYLLIINNSNLTIGIDNLDKDLSNQNIIIEPSRDTIRGSLEQMYEIMPANREKTGNSVNYYEKFYLKLNTNKTTYFYNVPSANKYITVKDDNLLYLTDDVNKAVLFSFTPVDKVFKCENNTCVPTELLPDSENVYRDSTCFNMCNKTQSKEFYETKTKRKPNNRIPLILIAIFLVLLVLAVILLLCL